MTDAAALGLRERKKREVRERIRAAAVELFVAHGYRDTTMEQVAAAADVAPRTVYRHFPTKDALVVTDEYDEQMLERFSAELADQPVLEAFRRALRQVMVGEMTQADRDRQDLIAAEPELQAAMLQFVLGTAERYAVMIVQRTGRTDIDRARALAGAAAGIALLMMRWDSSESMQEQMQRVDTAIGWLRSGFDI